MVWFRGRERPKSFKRTGAGQHTGVTARAGGYVRHQHPLLGRRLWGVPNLPAPLSPKEPKQSLGTSLLLLTAPSALTGLGTQLQ